MTGDDAAQLALLRALYLQRLAHRAAWYRQAEEAALIARTAIDNVIVGLYCLYHDDAVKQLTGGEHLAIRRVTAYLTREDDNGDRLFSREAILDAANAIGERGHDLNLKDVAEWLNKEKGLAIAVELYERSYAPLSHFLAHSSGFALMRHVRANGKLRRRPAFPWFLQSAVRVTDSCAGLMAAHIADKTGVPAKVFLRYTEGHLNRGLAPVFVVTLKRWVYTIGWRNLIGTLRTISTFGRYVRGEGPGDSPAQQEERVRRQYEDLRSIFAPDVPDAAFQPVIDELVAKVLASMSPLPGDPAVTATATQPDSASPTETSTDADAV